MSKTRSNKSLLALLNRRNEHGDHHAIKLIRPNNGSDRAVAVECSCGVRHPIFKSFLEFKYDEEFQVAQEYIISESKVKTDDYQINGDWGGLGGF